MDDICPVEGDGRGLLFLTDLRFGLDSPIGEGYLSNYVRACLASCDDAWELLDEVGLLHAARAAQVAVAEMEVVLLAGRAAERRHILEWWRSGSLGGRQEHQRCGSRGADGC